MSFPEGWADIRGWIVKKARSQANSFPVVVGCVCFTAPFHPHCECISVKVVEGRKQGWRDDDKESQKGKETRHGNTQSTKNLKARKKFKEQKRKKKKKRGGAKEAREGSIKRKPRKEIMRERRRGRSEN